MPPRIGYLLPTREHVMEDRPEAAPLLALAANAEGLGYDSIWVGDSLLARPRHDPLTLLAAVAARTARAELGTAVLLPALRNPVVLAQQIATLDQISQGRYILGVGIASDVPNIRAEFVAAGVPFEKRVGRMLEGLRLCRELWTGKPVNWNGRWVIENSVLGPTPHRRSGPPIWIGGMVRASRERVGRLYDGWFPNAPDAAGWGAQWREIQDIARQANPQPSRPHRGDLPNADDRRRCRTGEPADGCVHGEAITANSAAAMRGRQANYAGPAARRGGGRLKGYVDNGASHLVLRFAGDHERHLDMFARLRGEIGW